jgi:hypothetical protein
MRLFVATFAWLLSLPDTLIITFYGEISLGEIPTYVNFAQVAYFYSHILYSNRQQPCSRTLLHTMLFGFIMLALAGIGLLFSFAGFGTAGIVAASCAASWQSLIGIVAAGSLFAFL